jgi:UDP-N-acetylmuramoyl-L-alanyl-D-glutamate--2,6-diaminopimelate ligase
MAESPREIRIVAVTGTNGKTTTTSMVEAIVAASGEPSARVTTLGSWVSGEQIAEGTTLEAFTGALERAIEAGVHTLALEITSRALAAGFAQQFPASVAVFTNLSRDHLDYHGTPEHYLAAKAQLFMTLRPGCVAVLNACDPASALLDEVTPAGVRRRAYAGLAGACDECRALPLELAAHALDVGRGGTRIRLAPSALSEALGGELRLRQPGDAFAEDALAAALAADALGYSAEAIAAGLAAFGGVAGRFEIAVDHPLVVVDYAHTPDAIARTLGIARSLAGEGRVYCVFGCGGESDPGKRPEMGRAAVEGADVVIVTSDNPRSEDPQAIIDAVLAGAREGAEEAPGGVLRMPCREVRLLSDPDRASAIRRAVELCDPDRDVIVVAGKGHERVQWVGSNGLPFSDVEVASSAAAARSARKV